jgi:predicted nucleic acid-binding protein
MRAVLIDAIMRFGDLGVDFADAYHAAIAADREADVYSYDRDHDQFPDINRREP